MNTVLHRNWCDGVIDNLGYRRYEFDAVEVFFLYVSQKRYFHSQSNTNNLSLQSVLSFFSECLHFSASRMSCGGMVIIC
jgi:hypothetical protein